MINLKVLANEVYLYDGTFDGLLTIVFDCYIRHSIPCKIFCESNYVFNLLDQITIYKTDELKSKRIYDGIIKNISYNALYNCYYAFLSNDTNAICSNKEMEILKYLIYGFQIGDSINNMLSLDYVFKVQKLRKNVLRRSSQIKRISKTF